VDDAVGDVRPHRLRRATAAGGGQVVDVDPGLLRGPAEHEALHDDGDDGRAVKAAVALRLADDEEPGLAFGGAGRGRGR
jgi:hypothetical protein